MKGRSAQAVVAGLLPVGLIVGLLGGVPPTPASAVPPAHATESGATTLAGTGTAGFGGDGGPASRARLDGNAGIARDADGDLFIADRGNCRVREVVARSGRSFGRPVRAGEILTVAGGPCGDRDDPAPTALALDAAGDLFIASGPGNRIEVLPAHTGTVAGRRVGAGHLTVVAGTGRPGFSGDGGRATAAELDDPSGVAVDPSGDVVVADTANCRLRLVAGSAGSRFGVGVRAGDIETVAGDGTCGSGGDGGPATAAQLWDPGALAADARGDVLAADQGNRTIRILTSDAGTFYGVNLPADHLGTVAGEGTYGPYLVDGLPALGQTGELNFPSALAVDPEGNLYIADGAMHAIRLVPAAATTLLGSPVTEGDLYTVAGAVSTGTLYNQTKWVRTPMIDPSGLALAPGGVVIFSDAGANTVRAVATGR